MDYVMRYKAGDGADLHPFVQKHERGSQNYISVLLSAIEIRTRIRRCRLYFSETIQNDWMNEQTGNLILLEPHEMYTNIVTDDGESKCNPMI